MFVADSAQIPRFEILLARLADRQPGIWKLDIELLLETGWCETQNVPMGSGLWKLNLLLIELGRQRDEQQLENNENGWELTLFPETNNAEIAVAFKANPENNGNSPETKRFAVAYLVVNGKGRVGW